MIDLAAIQDTAAFDVSALRWDADALTERAWGGDPTVWSEEPIPELADRLGWLRLPNEMEAEVHGFLKLGESAVEEGITDVVLCGMGGSSLAPEVFARTCARSIGYPELHVLDSTHPEAVAALTEIATSGRTWFVISSKSGTTIETNALMEHFLATAGESSRFIAITDSGTSLAERARAEGFRKTFTAPSDVGGRFSALSPFGLAPAALTGVDPGPLIESASDLASRRDHRARHDPAVGLGLAWAGHAREGRDKLTFLTSPGLEHFSIWLEQLVAESLGKNGVGIVPVAGESTPVSDGEDRVFVTYRLEGETAPGRPSGAPGVEIPLSSPHQLGAEMLRAEMATAAAGQALGVNPFDQPDVEHAKRRARAALESPHHPAEDAVMLGGGEGSAAVEQLVGSLRPGDYLAIHAYLAPSVEVDAAVSAFRKRVTEATGCATTFGYGPRFLHSTGQLHKGGPPKIKVLQLVDRPQVDVPIEALGITFGRLVAAQAAGDRSALEERRRAVTVIDVTETDVAILGSSL